MRPTRIHGHKTKQPRRPHFIEQWAVKCGYEDQAALVEALGADKSIVSRWYSGASPGQDWREKLQALFAGDGGDPEDIDIFRDPDEDWLVRFFKDRSREEVERMKSMLEAGFPPKKSQNVRK